jgi:hypothetical protein
VASASNARSIEKLNDNNFHKWKMMMEFPLLEKDLWEITLGEYCHQKLNLERLLRKETLLNTTCS